MSNYLHKRIYFRALLMAFNLCWFSIAFGADQDMFEIYPLEVEGVIFNYLSGDFDGDELIDIAVIYSPKNNFNARYIGLFIQKETSGFKLKSDYVLTDIPATAAQVDSYDIDNDGRDEIVFIHCDGVSSIGFDKNTGFSNPARIIGRQTIHIFPQFHGIITGSFLFELNGNPGNEILLPINNGYAIYERNELGDYDLLNLVEVPIFRTNKCKSISEFIACNDQSININVAEISVADGNLDGRNDLYFLWDRKLCCFFQDAAGNFPLTPDVEIDFYPFNIQGFFQSRLTDYNGDNRPDVIVSYTYGGITNTETRVNCYMADANGRISSQPHKTITLSDSHCNLLIDDFNGDGSKDIVLPALELGSFAAIQMLLMKKADLHMLIYPIIGGTPTDEPSKRVKYPFYFDFSNPQPTNGISVEWSADFNGDRLIDMAFSDGNNRIKLFFGKSDDYLPKKSDLEISLDHVSAVFPIHLNNGGMSDLIVDHNLSGSYDRITVLKNKNNIF